MHQRPLAALSFIHVALSGLSDAKHWAGIEFPLTGGCPSMTRASSAQADVQATALHGKQPIGELAATCLSSWRGSSRGREGEREAIARGDARIVRGAVHLFDRVRHNSAGRQRDDASSLPYISDDRVIKIIMIYSCDHERTIACLFAKELTHLSKHFSN